MTGINALVALDGGTPLPEDLLVLRLAPESGVVEDRGFFARVRDDAVATAADIHSDGEAQMLFLGELHDAGMLAAQLDCAPRPAAIALAALRRWGPATMDHLKGEWTLLCRDRTRGDVWLGASRRLRDWVHFVRIGEMLAIAADIRRLAALSWVGEDFDPLGLAYSVGRARVRERGLGTTVLRNIFRLQAGEMHRFAPRGVHEVFHHAPDTPTLWQGSFDEALAQLEQALRRVTRRMLSAHQQVAILLSGGLDSALVAWLVAEERAPGQKVICLTAVAPPGSAHADERDLAASVAGSLGLEHRLVWPRRDAAIFQPLDASTPGGSPLLSPRHYLDDALFAAAHAEGASGVFNGFGGEWSVTRTHPRSGFIGWLGDVRRYLSHAKSQLAEFVPWHLDAYHVRLSPQLLAALPPGFAGPRQNLHSRRYVGHGMPMGLPGGYHAAWQLPSLRADGMRLLSPLHDPEIVALVAGMPPEFANHERRDRALARALLKDRLPENVRLQPKGLAYSVDYDDRLIAEAVQIQALIPLWREAGADAWLDLDWLAREAERMAAGNVKTVRAQFRVQLTAMTAEYFRQWKRPRN